MAGVSTTIRNFLIEEAGNKCTECEWDKVNPVTGKVPLEVDHIDGDHTNNVRANLRVICPNCHSLSPNFRALNKLPGRCLERAFERQWFTAVAQGTGHRIPTRLGSASLGSGQPQRGKPAGW